MDTARSLAADMVEEVGKGAALAWMARRLLRCSSWAAMRQGLGLLVAVIFA